MPVLSTSDPAEYVAATGDFLRRFPVEHSVLLGAAAAARDFGNADPLGLWLQDDRGVRAALHHVPAHPAHLSVADDADVRLIAHAVLGLRPDLPGVSGPGTTATTFAREWQSLTGDGWRVTRRFGVYRAGDIHVPDVEGRLRGADAGDVDLLQEWARGFALEAGLSPPDDGLVAARVRAARLAVWEVGSTPVSMAAATAPQADVTRIQLVYTPPAHRGHGYASACTAALTLRELALPGRVCILHTDLASRTANRIYPAIGYRRVADACEVRFER